MNETEYVLWMLEMSLLVTHNSLRWIQLAMIGNAEKKMLELHTSNEMSSSTACIFACVSWKSRMWKQRGFQDSHTSHSLYWTTFHPRISQFSRKVSVIWVGSLDVQNFETTPFKRFRCFAGFGLASNILTPHDSSTLLSRDPFPNLDQVWERSFYQNGSSSHTTVGSFPKKHSQTLPWRFIFKKYQNKTAKTGRI